MQRAPGIFVLGRKAHLFFFSEGKPTCLVRGLQILGPLDRLCSAPARPALSFGLGFTALGIWVRCFFLSPHFSLFFRSL